MSEKEIKEYTLKFHKYYERLAPNYGYETRKDTKEFDFNSNNGKLMYATVSEIISPLLQKVEQLEKEKNTLMYSLTLVRQKWNNDKARYRRKAKVYREQRNQLENIRKEQEKELELWKKKYGEI